MMFRLFPSFVALLGILALGVLPSVTAAGPDADIVPGMEVRSADGLRIGEIEAMHRSETGSVQAMVGLDRGRGLPVTRLVVDAAARVPRSGQGVELSGSLKELRDSLRGGIAH